MVFDSIFFPVIIPVYNFYYRLCYVTIIKLVKIMGFRFFSFFRTIFITLRDGNVIIRQFRNFVTLMHIWCIYIYIFKCTTLFIILSLIKYRFFNNNIYFWITTKTICKFLHLSVSKMSCLRKFQPCLLAT